MKYLIYSIVIIVLVAVYSLVSPNRISNSDAISLNEDYSALWLDDLALVQSKSDEEDKPILMYFTGSNWCGGCIRLNKDIFSNPAFIDFANEELILMKIDFPIGVQQKEHLVDQNNYLYDFYEIGGLPTVILVDTEGEKYRESGYGKESPKAYVAKFKELLLE